MNVVLADDASGAHDNPAGPVRIPQGALSISVDAFASTRLRFDDFIRGRAEEADGLSSRETQVVIGSRYKF